MPQAANPPTSSLHGWVVTSLLGWVMGRMGEVPPAANPPTSSLRERVMGAVPQAANPPTTSLHERVMGEVPSVMVVVDREVVRAARGSRPRLRMWKWRKAGTSLVGARGCMQACSTLAY